MSDDVNLAYPAPQGAPSAALLDVANALALLGDNTDLYLQIAKDFCAELVALQTKLSTLLHPDADLTEAKRVLHTFKGLSLTVGALAMSGACRQAESWIKGCERLDTPPDANALAMLRQQLMLDADATLRALADALPQLAQAPGSLSPDASDQPSELDALRLVQDLRALVPLLKANDMRAVDLNADIQKRHAAAHARLHALRAAVHSFDFAQGVVQCQALIRTLSDNN